MAAVIIISDGCGLRVEAHRINQPNKSKLPPYKPLLSLFKQLYTRNKTEHFNYKGGCSMHGRLHIETLKEELTYAIDQVISNKMQLYH